MPQVEPIPAAVWRVAFTVVLGAFMASLDTSLVTVGLDTIARSLHGSLTYTNWANSGYLLALAASLPLCGWLTRRFGSARIWRWALAAFTLLSGLCALAPTLPLLILARAAQGLSGGLLVPAGQTVIGRAAGPARMGRVMNTAGIAVVLAPALGPVIGGLLIQSLSWRWLFLVNLPIGVVALVFGVRLPTDEPQPAVRPDLVGSAGLVFGLPALAFGLAGLVHARVAPLAALAVGLAGCILFVARALRARSDRPALLDLTLFAKPAYAAAQVAVLFTGMSLFGGLVVLPLYYEELRGFDPHRTGLLLLGYGLGAAASLRLSGVLTDRIGGGRTALIGLAATIAATLPFVWMTADAPLVLVVALQTVRGAGVSFAGLPVMTSAYVTVSRDQLADATAQTNMLQRVGGALGAALFVILLSRHQPPDLAAFQLVFASLTTSAAFALLPVLWLAAVQRRGARR